MQVSEDGLALCERILDQTKRDLNKTNTVGLYILWKELNVLLE